MARSHLLWKLARDGFDHALSSMSQKTDRQQFAFTEALIRFLEHWTGGAPPEPAATARPARKPAAKPRQRSKGKIPRWKRLGQKKPGPKKAAAKVDAAMAADIVRASAAA